MKKLKTALTKKEANRMLRPFEIRIIDELQRRTEAQIKILNLVLKMWKKVKYALIVALMACSVGWADWPKECDEGKYLKLVESDAPCDRMLPTDSCREWKCVDAPPEQKTEWLGSITYAEKGDGKPFEWIMRNEGNAEIGLREDGVVLWRRRVK